MTSHVHQLVTPIQDRSFPLLMQAMGRNYVQRLNARYHRTGTLWEGRYKASLVPSNRYFLTCQRYIELNPVRAHMVNPPGDYAYSSFTHHACNLEPGADPSARQKAYSKLFRDQIDDRLQTRIRTQTNACEVIADSRFKEQIEVMLGRAVPTGRRGRPRLGS